MSEQIKRPSWLRKKGETVQTDSLETNFGSAKDLYEKGWDSLPNASVYKEGDYFGIFQTSDLLITDCSSFLGEYLVSEKPIIFLDKAERAGFNELGERIKKTF